MTPAERPGLPRLLAFPEARLILAGFLASAAWEALQTPLYADRARGAAHLFVTRLHCTLGDVLVLLAAHAVTALVFADRHWARARRRAPLALFVALGLAYTAWSEWLNVRVVGSWGYAEAMPTILGIGVAPLLQWLLVPLLVVAALRRGGAREAGR